MKKNILLRKAVCSKLSLSFITILIMLISNVKAQTGKIIFDGPGGETYRIPDGPKQKASKVNYALLAYRWKKCGLTYKFTTTTSDVSVTDQRNAVRSAFATWNATCGITFTEITSGTPDVTVGWAVGNHGDPYPFDGQGGVLAHTVASYSNSIVTTADIHFDDAEYWNVNGSSFDIETVALHEIGHLLGLDHSTNIDAVMITPYQTVRKALHSDDINAINAAYPPISGPASLCSGQSATFGYSYTGATSYTWSVTSGLSILSGQGTTSTTLSSNGNSTFSTLTVVTNNSMRCRTIISGKANTTNAYFNVVLDDGVHCYSHAFTDPVPSATAYTWTKPTSQTTVNPENPKPLMAGTTYSITVSAVNVCGTGPAINYTETTNTCAPIATNITTNDENKELAIYPNPANNSFEINLPSSETKARVTITNMMGQVIKDFQVNGSKTIVESADIPSGLYLVSINSDDFSKSSKLQIAR